MSTNAVGFAAITTATVLEVGSVVEVSSVVVLVAVVVCTTVIDVVVDTDS